MLETVKSGGCILGLSVKIKFFLCFRAKDGFLGVLNTALALVAKCLVVQACRSSYMDQALR